LSGGVTGEIHFVDSGYNAITMPHPDALRVESGTKDGGGYSASRKKPAPHLMRGGNRFPVRTRDKLRPWSGMMIRRKIIPI
jgi:hypothetical protein